MDISWEVSAVALGSIDEYVQAKGTRQLFSPMYGAFHTTAFEVTAPISCSEALVGDFRTRLQLRFEAYDLSCRCTGQDKCSFHRVCEVEWQEEDDDARDSWRERRGDEEARKRRLKRNLDKIDWLMLPNPEEE